MVDDKKTFKPVGKVTPIYGTEDELQPKADVGALLTPANKDFKPVGKVTPIATQSYTVGKGDNISKISREFGVNVEDMFAANPSLVEDGILSIGTKLNVPPPKPARKLTDLKYTDKDVEALARTMYGEARGSSNEDAMLNVGHVVLNRWLRGQYGDTVEEIVKKPSQFSAWMPEVDENHKKNYEAMIAADMSDPHYRTAYMQAATLLSQSEGKTKLPDTTKGATHYATHTTKTNWTDKELITIKDDKHTFFKRDN